MTDEKREEEPEVGDAAAEQAGSPETGEESTEAEPTKAGKQKNPAGRLTRIILAVVAVLLAWHITADRLTPYTSLGQIDGYVVPIASQVAGFVVDVGVVLNEVVERGDTLLRINPLPFELAVNNARAQLELSGQQMRAQTSAIESAAGQLGVARARLDRSQRYYDRVELINEQNPGALSQADRDRADTQLSQSEANVISAEAELERAKEQLGVEGDDNPAIRAAVAALEQAEFDLAQTVIQAPSRGVVGDLQLAEGHFAVAGQPLATFISAEDVWVRADMRENNLGRIDVGDPAEVLLQVAPGQIFKARVASVSAGVNTGNEAARGQLATAEQSQGWLRDPQRFPVIVRFEGEEARGFLRVGGQAVVTVYTGRHPIMNTIARLRIRLSSLFAYVR
jgi:multidrug resistance efflux pump